MIEEEKQPMESDDVSSESNAVESEVMNTEAVEPSASAVESSTEPQVEVVAEVTSGDSSALVDELNAKVATLEQQLEEWTNHCKRIAADFENFRKRTQKEKEDLEQQIKCKTVEELLPVVDNFERARSQIKPQGDEGMAIHKSYQGVYKDLVERLKRIGVSPMRSEGKEFDPNLHEAVMREPSEEYAEGTVIEELVRGYMLGDRVLRHAMVKVATAVAPSDDGDANSSSEG
ncbi:nucleotide exchange factor GrpE [Leptolyngbya sp. O-77]|uniref:nucleotide exchange factor GrpE n=1 Tax=Leptolyngbya sp. O-77 TaxID=1080068 RepID=UPI00074D3425|nr:nucleotide exchange factor GrpE [Leptolyngbya sp. O-77]BAU44693.1 heat shock protein GrpE [Leptolyngbya sp. O-77]